MSWSSSVPDVQTQRNYTIMDLNPSTQEYHDVEQHFLRTLKDKYKVIKISKIHNNDLWEEYSLCKRKMIKQLGANTLNELQLFHGTSQHVIPKIISKGFDWRLCGKNGTAYGKGSYFARDSSTSLKYISGTGHLQMFVASVLTGKAIKGNSSIVHEPEGYNCTVDRENNPKIFVVYHIKQAYPTYLITFEMQIWWTAYGAYLQPVNSVFDALFPLTQDQKNNTASRDFRQQIVQGFAALCAGMTSIILTNPLDVIRTRLQVSEGGKSTISREFQLLWREGGTVAMFKGLGPRIVAFAPASVMIITVYDLIKRLSLKDGYSKEKQIQ